MTEDYFWTRLLHLPGSYRDAAYVLLLIGLVAWFYSLKWRIADPVLVKYYRAISASLIVFCTLRIFKLTLDDTQINAARYLWYLFYIALFSFVTLTIMMAHHILKPPWTKVANLVLISTNTLLGIFVLTNDLHHFIFDFASLGRQAGEHRYNLGFVIISLWLALWALYMMASMLSICVWVRNWWHSAGLLIAVITFTAYAVSYMRGHAPHTEYVLTYIGFFMLMLETLIRSGAVPHNRKYIQLFAHTTVPVYLYDTHWQLQRTTAFTQGVPESVLRACQAGERHLPLAHPSNPQRTKEYLSAPITGGWAIWENDMSLMVKYRAELEQICAQLDRNLQLAKQELDTNAEKIRLNYQQEIASRVEAAVNSQLRRIEPLRDQLLSANDEQRAKNLRRIGIILGYCKRIGLAVLAAYSAADHRVNQANLRRHLENACIDFNSPSATAGFTMKSAGSISTNTAIDLISITHHILELAIEHHFPSVFMRYKAGRLAVLLDNTSQAQKLEKLLIADGQISSTNLHREGSDVLVVIDHA